MLKKVVVVLATLAALAAVLFAGTWAMDRYDLEKNGVTYENVRWTLDRKGVVRVEGEGGVPGLGESYGFRLWEKKNEGINPMYWVMDRFFDEIPAGTVILGAGITQWWEDGQPFNACKKLTEIRAEEDNPAFSSADGVLFNKDKTVLMAYPAGKPEKTYTVPDGVTAIVYGAFSYCEALEKVVLPRSLKTVGDHAFQCCQNLTAVVLPEGLERIGWSAFLYCSSLEEITLPDSLLSIDRCAFSGCKALREIFLPARLGEIGEGAFRECGSLRSFAVAPGSGAFAAQDGVLFDRDKTTLLWYPIGSGREEYAVPEGVTAIGKDAFQGNRDLRSVVFPASLREIGGAAFTDCGNLTSVVIPDGVRTIGSSAFSSCKRLREVIISKGTAEIGPDAFYDDASLTAVTIPANVRQIGDKAFGYACRGTAYARTPMKIFCEEGSAAERYAEENGISHEPVPAAEAA